MNKDPRSQLFHSLAQPVAGLQITLELAAGKNNESREYYLGVIKRAAEVARDLSARLRSMRDELPPESTLGNQTK